MKRVLLTTVVAGVGLLPLFACGQTQPALSPVTPNPIVNVGPGVVGPVQIAPEALDILKMLQDRKTTLKDFTAKIDYSTEQADIQQVSGKRGAVNFIIDPSRGPIFTVDFTADTDTGKVKRQHHQQVIFDGKEVTTKDFDPKEIMHANMLPAGAKPGDAVTLNGPLTLPIGLDAEDVARNFAVTLLPAKDADHAVLKLVPRGAKGKFDFTELQVTVDKKLQLPVKLVQTEKSRDIATIILTDIQINDGKAHMENTATPSGWTERK